MKKQIGVFAIIIIFTCSIIVMPVLGYYSVEKESNNLGLRWKILYVIGNVNYNFQAKLIYGYAIIGFVGGELIRFSNVYIEFKGLPLLIRNRIFSSFCIYRPVDV
jgi:hypothetical protein